MTRKQMILFTGIFLFIIYIVPVVQTTYEFIHNKEHHIQILDLLEDLFLTPARRANVETATINELKVAVDSISMEISKVPAPFDTMSTEITDKIDSKINEMLLFAKLRKRSAADYSNDAQVKIRLLKKNILDYNRHIKGANNPYIVDDTIKPYYKSLVKIEANLNSLLADIENEAPPYGFISKLKVIIEETALLTSERMNTKGLSGYANLTLTALRRNMVGASYLRPYEKEMENTSLFTIAVRPKYLLAYYALFGYLGDKGVQGRNGWLFYKPDVEYLIRPYVNDERSIEVDANDVPIKDAIVDSIKAFQQVLKDRGTDLIVIIMPAKPSIYPEMLAPDMNPDMSGKISHSVRMIDELKRAGVETVDLYSAFSEERKNDVDAGDSLYMRTDTHFRTRAVRTAARVVGERIKKYPWYVPGITEFEIDTITIHRNGDISEMTKLNSLTIRDLMLSFPPEAVKCYQVYKINRDANNVETERSLYKDDYRNSQVLVIGDSYSRIYQTDEPRSAGWISHLAVELSQPVASIVNDGGASTLVRETLARKINVLKGKKVVVWEIVERDLRFGDKGWRNVSLAQNTQNTESDGQ